MPPISTIGLGRISVSSANRVPNPPARIPTFMALPLSQARYSISVFRAIYSGADMTKPDEIHAMVKEAETKLGRYSRQQRRRSACRANRGVSARKLGHDHRDQSLRHAMATAIPGMKARKWGRILSTASAHSLVASPFKSAYVAAKHGRSHQNGAT